jgi:hypothetical protein
MRKMRLVILAALILVSCDPRRNQWVLQAYDEDKGYTFAKDGVSYQAHCYAMGRPVIGNNVPDPNPDALPPNPAFGGERDCTAVLPYLHRPIPIRQVDGSLLLFSEGHNFKLEFETRQAK